MSALGQSLTKQYVALRKHSNLKRVYWVMDARSPGVGPWEDELRRFFAQEQLPFTVVLNKVDRLGEHPSDHRRRISPVVTELPKAVARVQRFIGTDQVPILETSGSGRPRSSRLWPGMVSGMPFPRSSIGQARTVRLQRWLILQGL